MKLALRLLAASVVVTLCVGRAHAHEGYGARASVTRKAAQTASTTVVSGEDVAATPTRTAEDALRLVPGLVLVQHGSEGKGYQFFLRGFDAVHGADLEVTLEGIPLNEWSNVHAQGYLDLGLMPAEAVHNIEVNKGPFTLTQGAFGMAGSANYELGIAEKELGWRAAYTVGTTQRHRLMFSYAPRERDGHDLVAGEALIDRGYGENRDTRRGSLVSKVSLFESQHRGRLNLLSAAGAAQFGLPGTVRNEDYVEGRLGFYDAYQQRTQGLAARALMGLAYEWEGAGQLVRALAYGGYRKLDLFENFTGYAQDPVNGDFRSQRQDAWSFGFKADYARTLVEHLTLKVGTGLRGDALSQRERAVDAHEDFVAPRRRLSGVQVMPHAHAGLLWEATKWLRAEGGARVDLAHVAMRDELAEVPARGTEAALSPRAIVTLRAHPTLKLIAAYGRGLRPPEARAFSRFKPAQMGISDELSGDSGKPHFTQSHAFELGGRARPSRYFGADLSGFATLIEREFIYDHVSGTNLELNGTRRLGGELVLMSWPLEWLRFSADLTMVDARFVGSNERVPLAPWLTAGMRSVLTHPSGFHGGLRFVGVAPRPLPHGARGHGLYMVDLTAGYRWQWLRVDLAVENLLARKNREGEYHFASHWQRDQPASALPALQYIAGPPLNARLTVSVVF